MWSDIKFSPLSSPSFSLSFCPNSVSHDSIMMTNNHWEFRVMIIPVQGKLERRRSPSRPQYSWNCMIGFQQYLCDVCLDPCPENYCCVIRSRGPWNPFIICRDTSPHLRSCGEFTVRPQRVVYVCSILVPLTIPGTKFSTRPYIRSCGELTTRPYIRCTCGTRVVPCDIPDHLMTTTVLSG